MRVTQVLDATCSVDFNACSALMSRLAADIRKESNCGRELRDQNPLVMQARDGLLAYQPLYQAGCLKSSTGSYCTFGLLLPQLVVFCHDVVFAS